MKQHSWLDNPDTAYQHFKALSRYELTEEDGLNTINRIRARSGDRPLTMSEFIEADDEAEAELKMYERLLRQNVFQRIHEAIRYSWTVFKAMVRR